VFPEGLRPLAQKLYRSLHDGHRNFPGFEPMFRTRFAKEHVSHLAIATDLSDPAAAGAAYRDQISTWNESQSGTDPQLALVLVPHSEHWETETPYYESKALFARLGMPTQMVTAELLQDDREFGWSVANIALATFAKLGGIPWVVEAPAEDQDLVLGIGRADIRHAAGPRRIFGYAVAFTSNGAYRQVWGFAPAADEETYAARLEDALVRALTQDVDEPFRRLTIHLTKRTGRREIDAVRAAMTRSATSLPVAFLRVDDSSLYDLADGRTDTLAPPKGLAVRLESRRALLQTEELGPMGPAVGPLLIELDRRSDVEAGALDGLVDQAFRLAHANWRGFNARAQPVTLAYGELLASLVGYLEEVDTWDPSLLRSELRDRPWFL
jgi:hypothetical protein